MNARHQLAIAVGLAVLMASTTSWGQAEQKTPLLGSPSNGDAGEWRCPRGAYLVGFEGSTTGEGFHALTAICGEYREDGTRGTLTRGPRFGGTAGAPVTKMCPEAKPFVRSMDAWTASGQISMIRVGFQCGPMTGSFGPTVRDETSFSFGAGVEAQYYLLREHSIQCPAGYGYGGIHARSNVDLDALGAICRPATPVKRVATVGKKPAPQTQPIRNPADTTTVLSRTTGPTMAQQSTAAAAVRPTREQQAHAINSTATSDIASRVDADQIICRGAPSLGIQPVSASTPASPSSQWALYFIPARGPAKADGSGLEPGQCAYVDRAWPGGPPGILFDVTAGAGAPSPTQYLSDSAHYWSFVATNNGRGMYVASRNSPYRDPGATATSMTAQKPRCENSIVGMRNDLDSRMERIRCENTGLTPNQRAELNARLDEVLKWLATAR